MSQQDATLETPWVLPSFCSRNTCPRVRRQADGTIQVGSTVSDESVTYTQQEFQDFITAVRSGEYDRLVAG